MLLNISIAMLAFAANSVLCRLALAEQQIDPMSFSLLRVCSGAMVLFLLYVLTTHKAKIEWSIKNGFFLALYIVAFSLAYLHIDAGVGALLLFGTVQLSMVSYGLCHGEKNKFATRVGVVDCYFRSFDFIAAGGFDTSFGLCCIDGAFRHRLGNV